MMAIGVIITTIQKSSWRTKYLGARWGS